MLSIGHVKYFYKGLGKRSSPFLFQKKIKTMDKPVYNITVNSPVTIHIHQSSSLPIVEQESIDLSKMDLGEDRVVSKGAKCTTNL